MFTTLKVEKTARLTGIRHSAARYLNTRHPEETGKPWLGANREETREIQHKYHHGGGMGAEENLMKTTPLFFSEWVLTL